MWKNNHILPSWYIKQNTIKMHKCWAYFLDINKNIIEKEFPQGISPNNKIFTKKELYSVELEKQTSIIDCEIKNRFDYYFSNKHFYKTKPEVIAKFVIGFIYYFFERSPSAIERTKIWDMSGDFIGLNSAWASIVWNREFVENGELKGQITHCYEYLPTDDYFLIGNNMWCRIDLKDLYDVHKLKIEYGSITLLQIKKDYIYIMIHSPSLKINEKICKLIENPLFFNKLRYLYKQNIIRKSDTYIVSTKRINLLELETLSRRTN